MNDYDICYCDTTRINHKYINCNFKLKYNVTKDSLCVCGNSFYNHAIYKYKHIFEDARLNNEKCSICYTTREQHKMCMLHPFTK